MWLSSTQTVSDSTQYHKLNCFSVLIYVRLSGLFRGWVPLMLEAPSHALYFSCTGTYTPMNRTYTCVYVSILIFSIFFSYFISVKTLWFRFSHLHLRINIVLFAVYLFFSSHLIPVNIVLHFYYPYLFLLFWYLMTTFTNSIFKLRFFLLFLSYF